MLRTLIGVFFLLCALYNITHGMILGAIIAGVIAVFCLVKGGK